MFPDPVFLYMMTIIMKPVLPVTSLNLLMLQLVVMRSKVKTTVSVNGSETLVHDRR